MADESRLRVLVVTTNFPLERRGDRTGNFVYDPVMALDAHVDQTVLMPNHATTGAPTERLGRAVRVRRFAYWFPRRAMRLAHDDGIPSNLRASWIARLQLPALLAVYAWHLLVEVRRHDVVHAHWLPLALLAWPFARVFRRPLAVTLHGTDITQFPDRFVAWGLRRMDVVVSAHDDLLGEVARLAPTAPTARIRHLVEPQPVDADVLAEVRAAIGDGPLALFVARLSPERDPVSFVEAVPFALELAPAARFAVVGDGPLRADVEDAIDRLGLRGRVTTFGHRPDVWTFLTAADVFAALSDRTNVWVTAVVEAMRAGLPVVATMSGLTADTLTDDVDALLVPIADAEAIGRALGRLLADPAERARIAAGATATLRDAGFDPDHVRDETLSLYVSLTA